MSDFVGFIICMGIMIFFTGLHLWAVSKHPEWFKDYNHWGDM